MIAGIDYDTNRIAVCVLADEDSIGGEAAHFVTRQFRAKKQDAFQATMDAFDETKQILWSRCPGRTDSLAYAVHAWWIEHAFGSGPTDFKLGRVQGAVVAGLRAIAGGAVVVNEVGPPEWKAGIGLGGNAKKAVYQPQLRLLLSARYGVDVELPSEHEADAFGIALYGQTENRRAFA